MRQLIESAVKFAFGLPPARRAAAVGMSAFLISVLTAGGTYAVRVRDYMHDDGKAMNGLRASVAGLEVKVQQSDSNGRAIESLKAQLQEREEHDKEWRAYVRRQFEILSRKVDRVSERHKESER